MRRSARDLRRRVTSGVPLAARYEFYLLGVVVFVGLLLHNVVWTSVFAIGATLLSIAAVFSRWQTTDSPGESASRDLAVAKWALAATAGLVVWRLASESSVVVGSAVAVAVVVAFLFWRSTPRAVTADLTKPLSSLTMRYGITVSLVLLVLLIGWSAMTVKVLRIDVIEFHRVAADVLADGRNPYVELGVVNTSPLVPEGTLYESYPYPPSALMPFVAAEWTLRDARWASALAAAVFVLLLCAPWARVSNTQRGMRFALALLFVSMPLLGSLIRSGFTDLLAVPLILGSAMLWRRNPVAASVLLGLALSTKAYFALALPLLLFWPDEYRWKRLLVVAATASATFVPFLIWDAESVLGTVGAAQIAIPFRPDSLGLAGLGLNVARWLSYLLAGSVAVVIGMRGGKAHRWVAGLTAVLALVFLTGFQAFFNYWMLVAALAMIAIVSSSDSGSTSSGECAESAPIEDGDPSRRAS